MEDTHGGLLVLVIAILPSLNPYYNGRYSWSPNEHKAINLLKSWGVLILIIMEDTHGGFADGTKALLSES